MTNIAQVISESFIDIVTQNSYSITQTRNELRDQINDAIAAAVQAEREANIDAAPNVRLVKFDDILGWSNMTHEEHRMWRAGYMCAAQDYIAAIRARSVSAGAEQPALYDDKISDEDADALDAEQEEEAAEFLGIKPAKPKRIRARGNGGK